MTTVASLLLNIAIGALGGALLFVLMRLSEARARRRALRKCPDDPYAEIAFRAHAAARARAVILVVVDGQHGSGATVALGSRGDVPDLVSALTEPGIISALRAALARIAPAGSEHSREGLN